MRRNQEPASRVSTTKTVTAQERMCWQFCVGLWSTAHTAGCWVVVRTYRWFSTITHWRCLLTNQLCAGYYNNRHDLVPRQTSATLQRATFLGTDSTKHRSCWWWAHILWLELQQEAQAAHSHAVKPLSWSWSHTQCMPAAGTGLHQGPGQQSKWLQSAFTNLAVGESRRYGRGKLRHHYHLGLSQRSAPEGNPVQMSGSFLLPHWNAIRAPQLWAWPRPLKRLRWSRYCCSFSTCCQASSVRLESMCKRFPKCCCPPLRVSLLTCLECSQAGHNVCCSPAWLNVASVRNGASREARSQVRGGKQSSHGWGQKPHFKDPWDTTSIALGRISYEQP